VTRTIKRGDLEPPLRIVVGGDEETADLSGASEWRLHIRKPGGTVLTYTSPGGGITVTVDPADPSKATIVHPLQAADTDEVGRYRGEVEAMWPGSPLRPQTFPNSGTIRYEVEADLA